MSDQNGDAYMVVTDGDHLLCDYCYNEGLDEQDPATHVYARIPYGVCQCCGVELADGSKYRKCIAWRVHGGCGNACFSMCSVVQRSACKKQHAMDKLKTDNGENV